MKSLVIALIAASALTVPVFAQVKCNEGMEPLDRDAESRISAQDFVKDVAAKEMSLSKAFGNYGYMLEIVVQTLQGDQVDGEFRQTSVSSVDDKGTRRDTVSGITVNTLRRIKFSDKDAATFRDTLPFALTADKLADRDIVYAGRQKMGEVNTHVFDILPRTQQDIEKAFEGRVWVRGRDRAILKTCGRSASFPIAPMRYEGIRAQIAGNDDYVPLYIRADEAIPVDSDKVHVRINVKYSDYKARP